MSASYPELASEIDTYLIGESCFTPNVAPPIARSEFFTTTFIATVSPGSAFTSGITHSTEPLTGGTSVTVTVVVVTSSLVVVTSSLGVSVTGEPTVITPGITFTFQESEFCPLLYASIDLNVIL